MSFDQIRFYEALEQKRTWANLSWRELARRLSLSPSTFSRLAQGRRPDVDTFVKLLAWMERPASDFTLGEGASEWLSQPPQDTVREISQSLQQDSSLSRDDAKALEDIVRVAYHRFRNA